MWFENPDMHNPIVLMRKLKTKNGPRALSRLEIKPVKMTIVVATRPIGIDYTVSGVSLGGL